MRRNKFDHKRRSIRALVSMMARGAGKGSKVDYPRFKSDKYYLQNYTFPEDNISFFTIIISGVRLNIKSTVEFQRIMESFQYGIYDGIIKVL